MKHLGILTIKMHFSNKILSKHFQTFTEIPVTQGLLLPKEEISGQKNIMKVKKLREES